MSLVYPSDISSAQSFVTFTRMKNSGFITAELRHIDSKFKNIKTTPVSIIALPIPNGLSDSSSVSYIDNTDSSVLESGGKALLNAVDPTGKVKAMVSSTLAVGVTNQQFNTYNAVGIKSWAWSWTLVPESQQEAQAISDIINEFRDIQLPYYGSSDSELNFPDLVKIKFGGVTPKILKYLPSVITDVSVNTGDFFQMYTDGNLPEVNLTVSFSEIVSRTRDIQRNL